MTQTTIPPEIEPYKARIEAIFDASHYLAANPDVAASGAEPLRHYLCFGLAENRTPGPGFDPAFYLSRHPDAAGSGQPALLHYLQVGEPEGRPGSPAAAQAEAGNPHEALLQPYLERIRAAFDPLFYLSANGDVAESDIAPIVHYLRHGISENRAPNPRFDPAFYLASYPDAAESDLPAFLHYLEVGEPEGRTAHPHPVPVAATTPPAGSFGHDSFARVFERDFTLYQYALLEPHFDAAYYCRRYPDMLRSQMDPLTHFVLHGGVEGRNPSPHFDTKYYLRRYPDVRKAGVNPLFHYLTAGRIKGYGPTRHSADNATFKTLCEALPLTPQQAETAVQAEHRDLVARLEGGELGEMVAKAVAIDPLIQHGYTDALEAGHAPFRSDRAAARLAAMLALQEAADWKPARAVIVIPWNHLGGATRLTGHLAHALTEILGTEDVLVIYTQASEWDYPQWFPPGCRHVDFAAAAQGLDADTQQRVLFEFLRALCPDRVLNVNSRLFYEMLDGYGTPLMHETRLYTYFFCNERNAVGDWVGYPIRRFHGLYPYFTRILTDSHALRDELTGRFMIGPGMVQKVAVLDTPIRETPPALVVPDPTPKPRARVLWAGRFDRQKRVDIVYRIAEALPQVDFLLWGEAKLDRSFQHLTQPANVSLMGIYSNLDELPFEQADLWLYTSEWDGVPNMLIEISTTGVPLVGALAGGTGEILMEGMSHPVASIEDVDGFVAAIRDVLDNPERARAMAARLRDHVLTQRDPARYRAQVAEALELEMPHG